MQKRILSVDFLYKNCYNDLVKGVRYSIEVCAHCFLGRKRSAFALGDDEEKLPVASFRGGSPKTKKDGDKLCLANRMTMFSRQGG